VSVVETAEGTLLGYLRTMTVIRHFEQRVTQLRHAGDIIGSVHLAIGQEAIPVGALAALSEGDAVFATYRGHGWAIACGAPLAATFAELLGRETGVNGGRGGSAHFSVPEVGFYGENSIVGAGAPIATGAALAARHDGSGRVAVCSLGDGAMNQGAVHEAMNFAAALDLPVIFVCENNRYSELTPIADMVRNERLFERAQAYGMPGERVDGNDPSTVREAVARAVELARSGGGPTLVEAMTERLVGHYIGDSEAYRPPGEVEEARKREPLVRLRARLRESGVGDDVLDRLEREVEAEVERAAREALAAPPARVETVREHLYAPRWSPPRPPVRPPAPARRELTYVQAVNAALHRALEAYPEALVFGEDVGLPGGVFTATRGLRERFGERVFDTPISEAAILGGALGAAMLGRRPIAEIMWADFTLVALDQIVNQATNVRYVSRGALSAPLTIRTQQGVLPGSCAQHSQSLESFFAHVPGLLVCLPVTPQDAHDLLLAAIAADDPVIVLENRALYSAPKQTVDLDGPIPPIGEAAVRRSGGDVTVVSWGRMVNEALAAAEALAGEGIDVEVIDARWLAPFDTAAVLASVERTGRLLVAHEANVSGAFGAEVAARVLDEAFYALEAPIRRVGVPDSRIPAAPGLQRALVPDRGAIATAVRELAAEAG